LSNRSQAIEKFIYIMDRFTKVADTAPDTHAAVLHHLAKHGYSCSAEMCVAYNDGIRDRNGRVDVVVRCKTTNYIFAIEIDARKPRRKSLLKLAKLRQTYGAIRVVMLRGVGDVDDYVEGVDVLVALPVRLEGDGPRASVREAAKAVAQ
jgi:hypothetical protein